MTSLRRSNKADNTLQWSIWRSNSCRSKEPRIKRVQFPPSGNGNFMGVGSFALDQIRMNATVDALTKLGVRRRCGHSPDYFGHLLHWRLLLFMPTVGYIVHLRLWSCLFVCLFVCPRSKTKTARIISDEHAPKSVEIWFMAGAEVKRSRSSSK